MYKNPLLAFVLIFLSLLNNSHTQNFYTQVVGGEMHRQVKQFERKGETNVDGWIAYRGSTLDPKNIQYLEYRYEVNCRLRKAEFREVISKKRI